MAIAALVFWMCTAAAGTYLLATGTRVRQADPAAQPVPVTAQAAKPRRDKDRFDPPSLQRAKSEPLPGLRGLAEFAHPALAIVGLGFWLAYVMSRDRVFAAIGLGVLLGAICAGVSWFARNARAARRARAIASAEGEDPGAEHALADALTFSPRLIILHAVGAVLTLLIVALIAARA